MIPRDTTTHRFFGWYHYGGITSWWYFTGGIKLRPELVVLFWWYHTDGITAFGAFWPETHPHVPLTQIWLRDMNSSKRLSAIHGPLTQSLSPQEQVPRLWVFPLWGLPARCASGGSAPPRSMCGAVRIGRGYLPRARSKLKKQKKAVDRILA
mgnify:CR=1 FL=1